MSDFEVKEIQRATKKAMDYLARRDHSELELKNKLLRHFTPRVTVAALLKCYESGWMSTEEELVERAVLSLERKLKSHQKLVQFLRKRGLPSPPFDSDNEIEKARQVVAKYASDESTREDLFRLLHNRGFDKSTIRKVCYDLR